MQIARPGGIAALLLALLLAVSGAPALAADAAKGKKVYNKCRACHQVAKERNSVGPHLVGVFGRTAGTVPKFRYSKAMKQAGADGLVWNDETIAEYMRKPKAFIKGNKMAFAGLKKQADIDNLLAYLKEATAK